MELVTGAMGSLVPKLGELLKEEYKLQKGVREQVESLSQELNSMHAALRKVADVQRDQLDEQVKLWAGCVREMSYDVEDIVDTFLVHVEGRDATHPDKLKRFQEMMANLFTKSKARHQIAGMIKEIKDQVDEVAQRHGRYTIDSIQAKSSPTSTIDPRLSALFQDVTNLVGIEEQSDKLIKILFEGDDDSAKKMKIVSIVGFGGLGKTTLANAVHQKLRAEFKCVSFVSVGQNPDRTKIFRKMLRQLQVNNYQTINEARDEEELITELRAFLTHKRYFIVIDDVWDKQLWDVIHCALVENNNGSRIIITTRNLAIAEQVGSAYKLEPLSLANSRDLFYGRIYGHGYKFPGKQVAEISEKILYKCGGVPLAIITIASLLATTDKIGNIGEWYKLHDSIVFGLENSPKVENMRTILSLSYYNLPLHLRTCLLYLSIFPEDYKIRRDRLIWRWVGEGIVCEKHGMDLFEVGKSYFNELVNSSMIQLIHSDHKHDIQSCRVHDMILDLISYLTCEENFVTILDNKQRSFPSHKVRRLSLHSSEADRSTRLANGGMSHVRSISLFSHATNIMAFIASFHVLRVLDLEDCDLKECNHLKHIGGLFHLRYLGLRNTGVTKLPKEIGNLIFLQTLDLYGKVPHELPPTSVGLKRLMCLIIKLRDNFGSLEALGHLTELRTLQISMGYYYNSEQHFFKTLCNMRKIQNLDIDFSSGSSLDFMRGGWAPRHLRSFRAVGFSSFSTLPMWINPSVVSDLSILQINVEVLRQEDVQILGSLPALRSLSLGRSSIFAQGTKGTLVVDGGLFQCLRVFTCRYMVDLVFQPGAMPRVQIFSVIVAVGRTEDAKGDFYLGSLSGLPSLEQLTVGLWCKAADEAEVKEAEAALRHTAEVHPNHPTLAIEKLKTKFWQ